MMGDTQFGNAAGAIVSQTAGALFGFLGKKDDNKTARQLAELQLQAQRGEITHAEYLAAISQQDDIRSNKYYQSNLVFEEKMAAKEFERQSALAAQNQELIYMALFAGIAVAA